MKYKHFISLGAVAVALLLCAALPAFLARGHDMQQINTVHTVEMEPIRLGEESTYTLPQRLALLSGQNTYEDAQTMVFQTGINYDHQRARKNARTQMDLMHESGLLPESSDMYTKTFVNGVEFTADSHDPACSLMQWEIHAISERYFITLSMDDETGKILQYHVACNQTDDTWTESMDLSQMAQAWAAYLDLTLKEEEETKMRDITTIWFPNMQGIQTPELDDNSHVMRVVVGDEQNEVEYCIYVTQAEFWAFVA